MRKKLLALLMCATMVLGSSAVAFAAPSNDDYKNAETILKQYNDDKGNIKGEYDAKKENVTFSTELVKKDTTNENVYSIRYSYVFDSRANENSYVKVNSDSKKLQLTDGNGYVATVLDAAKHKITTTATADELNNSVVKFNDELYYATTKEYKAGETVESGYAVNQSITLGAALAANTKVVTLEAFDGKATGTITVGKDANFVNEYGIDVDGYINLARSKSDEKLSQKIADGYWVSVNVADANAKTDVANALAAGIITKNAAAVNIDLYKTVATDNKTYDNGSTVQYGFQKLIHVTADVASHDVTFKTDWLSQSAAKNANVVYILDKNVPTFTEYFQRIGSIYKVSDLADEKFSTNYLVSGTYIFDVATDASNNDGVSDTTTAAAASTTTTNSPKTGDVAPIAALAVVMMGACGAMVVASKKRA